MSIIKSSCLAVFLVMGTFLIAQNKSNGPVASSYGAVASKSTTTFALEEVGLINTASAEFAPTLYNGKLVFASSGSDHSRKATSNLYQSDFEDNLGYYVSAVPFEDKFNSKDSESTTSFSKDGNTVYFTRHNGKTASIFKSVKKNGKWSRPKELPFCSSNYSVAHPSLNADNTRLYFASDMPGTIGSTDIWYVKIGRRDTYSKPVNLGYDLNTKGKESHPFISDDGALYFASDTRPGLGGLDIFQAMLDESTQEIKAINHLGEPINSVDDDYSLILDNETQKGFFTSNRASGRGNLDIYKFSKKEVCYAPAVGKIFEKKSNQVLAGVQVALLDTTNRVLETTVSDRGGSYRFDNLLCDTAYRIRASQEPYATNEISVSGRDQAATGDAHIFLSRAFMPVSLGDDLAKTLNLNTISFGVDRFTIEDATALELDKVIAFMNENPTIKIDVRSHTDSRSRDSYNQQLSNKRNAATIAYLIENGVSKRRVTGKGYGESQPLNRCTNGVKCTEQEHQVNRRSEFIVVKM